MKFAFVVVLGAGMAACRGSHRRPPYDGSVRDLLKGIEASVRDRNPDSTISLFSPDSPQGVQEIRRQVETFLAANRVTQLEFWVDSIHRRDGLIWVKTHWKRVIHDAGGRPSLTSGRSDFILRDGRPLRIREVRGSPLF